MFVAFGERKSCQSLYCSSFPLVRHFLICWLIGLMVITTSNGGVGLLEDDKSPRCQGYVGYTPTLSLCFSP